METNLYFTVAIVFAALVLTMVLFILYVLRYALSQTAWSESKKKSIFRNTALLLLGWLGALAFLASQGFFLEFNTLPPRMLVAVAPPLLTIAVLANIRAVNYLLQFIPASWLVYLQSFRVVVEIILWMLFVAELLPVQMSFEGRNFDVLVGLTAPLAAYFFFGKHLQPRWGMIWNILGLGLLLNIIIIAFLSVPAPFRIFMNEPANTIVAHFPMIWLPGFLVPVALVLHVFSIKQLLLKTKAEAANRSQPLQKVMQ